MNPYCIDPTHPVLEQSNESLRAEISRYRIRLEEEGKLSVDAEAKLYTEVAVHRETIAERDALKLQIDKLRHHYERAEGEAGGFAGEINKLNEQLQESNLQIDALKRSRFEQEPRTCIECGQNLIDCAEPGCAKSLKEKLEQSNRLNSEMAEILHKISCAECSIHDDHCERGSGIGYCACDARLAGTRGSAVHCALKRNDEKWSDTVCPKCGKPKDRNMSQCNACFDSVFKGPMT